MDSFSKRLASLSPEKQKLFELYLKNKQIGNLKGFSSIQPITEYGSYPPGYFAASSAQKRLYLINQMEKESTAYNLPMAMLIEGDLDRERLVKSFTGLIKRHETLRTSFELIDGEPVQRVHQDIKFEISYFNIEEDESEERAHDIIRNLIRPFDLSKAPLLRVGLIKLPDANAQARHLLVYDMHHIISDGTSMGIIIKELIALYQGDALPELRIQYKDFASWQNRLLNTGAMKKQEDYWLQVFSKDIPVLDMFTDYARPALQSFEGDAIFFKAGEKITKELEVMSSQSGATLFMILLAAFNVLLAKFSGQEDIVVGTPIAGRRHADLENIVGLFINTLAIRNYPGGNKRFSDFLAEVKEELLNVYDNQDYQFETLVEKLNVKRDLSRNPLFDVMFIWNIKITEINIAGLKFKPYEYVNRVSKFDMTLTATEVNDAGVDIIFNLEYCNKLFKKETIMRVKEYFINLLREIVKNPEIKISDIDILTNEEKTQILSGFNNTQKNYPREKPIHCLFEERVENMPDEIAVIFKDRRFTYRELNEKANQLAGKLRKMGVKPDTIAGIMVKRSPEMIIGILGILKAGGAYLPIDPDYPEERIQYMLEDSQAAILLTQSDIGRKVDFNGEYIFIDNINIYREDSVNLENINSGGDLAYVIYTSGSTGKPKGVMIGHRAVGNFISGISEKISFTTGKTILCLTTISFDIFVLETLLPLVKGMKIVIADEAEQKDPKLLREIIKTNEVEMLQVTPSRLKSLMDVDRELHCLDRVKEVMVGGEAMPQKLFESLREIFNTRAHTKIYNLYGPTEATVWSAIKDLSGANKINIGKPIANTQIFIINKVNKLQPVGIPGEICIGGDGLARGYLNRPDLTAEKFVPNPFYSELCAINHAQYTMNSEQPILGANSEPKQFHTSRIYRTGDYGRWLPDGDIEFLGRFDHQVKIRGYRIELGEIENKLLGYSLVKEAVVVDKTDLDGNKYLCAYIVWQDLADAHTHPTVSEIREYLLKVLPDYMIPTYFVTMDKMPLTPNGKLDRSSLPNPDDYAKTKTEYTPPRNEIESILVEIWQKVLGVKNVGINDNFFDLGGDSLKAVRVIGLLDGYSLNVMSFMQHPTIAQLQAYVTRIDETRKELSPGMVENLEIEYYFFKDGEPDPVTSLLDCNSQMIYFTLKKKVKDYNKYIALLLQDIVFCITQNSNRAIYDINLMDYPFRGDIFKINYVESQGYQVMGEIEKLLDRGEQVVVGTCAKRVPFHKDFDGFDAPYLPIVKGHTFLAVAHDEMDLYYVEIPGILNEAYFTQYPKNKSIGIIKKKDLQAAFEVYADYGTIMIDETNLHQAVNLKGLFDITLENYNKDVVYQDGFKVSYGRKALDLLIDLSGEECLRLDTVEGLYNVKNLSHLFEWKFYVIGSRRKLLRDVLAEYTQNCNIHVKNNLIDILDKSYKGWRGVHELTKRKYWMEKDYIVGREYQAMFTELKALEQELIESLTRLHE